MQSEFEKSEAISLWRIVGWLAYVCLALVCTFIALMAAGPWFTLALVLAFVFGPKIFKRL